jgi:hypothetical protein
MSYKPKLHFFYCTCVYCDMNCFSQCLKKYVHCVLFILLDAKLGPAVVISNTAYNCSAVCSVHVCSLAVLAVDLYLQWIYVKISKGSGITKNMYGNSIYIKV